MNMKRYVSLKNATDFNHVFRFGVRSRQGGITLLTSPGPTEYSRLGLVVGRRVGSAVVRNRVKRRLRAAVREVGLPHGVDCVVLGSKAVADVPFSILCGWIHKASAGFPTERV